MGTTSVTPGEEAMAVSVPDPPTVTRRRPSGEPPPLPRPVSATTRLCAALIVVTAALSVALATDPGVRVVTRLDLAVLRALARARSGFLTDVARAVMDAGSTTSFRVLAWLVLGVLLVARRFQHLFATFALLLAVPLVLAGLRELLGRMRPGGIEIIGSWEGYAYPSRPVTEIALVLTLVVLVLVPSGAWRRRAGLAAGILLALLGAARLYTAVDHPSDVLAGLALGGAVPVVALRLLTPEEAFPVTYRRGVRAHLDVGGRRGEAIRRAFDRQLGVQVERVRPFAWGGSAGSTPLYIETATGDDLFGKLYAWVHLRSDRWYKLARTVRYGRLEDERPFNSVRRLVQYEDHMLRVVRDAGILTPRPWGIVEITPEREYVVVTDLVPGAVHLDEAEVTDDVVDEALAIVRKLWDAGLAHRDIKPSNLLVADGHVWLIDLAFAEIRPSPWRQAADLANMMLTLSLCVPAERVYERALLLFTPDEVAEAFAASRPVTAPAQLRARLRERDDDAPATFRRLAPHRPPIAIQRWTLRRLGLTLAVVVLGLLALLALLANLALAGLL
jgi:tRNA A-37 threonylcarbamoyl transferase component Bud32/membrane-associated phospholipid phosphatase